MRELRNETAWVLRQGDATRDSDLDVLVVTSHEVECPRLESVRLRNSLSDINIATPRLRVETQELRSAFHKAHDEYSLRAVYQTPGINR
jgi:predicted nucleotidyltransferase